MIAEYDPFTYGAIGGVTAYVVFRVLDWISKIGGPK